MVAAAPDLSYLGINTKLHSAPHGREATRAVNNDWVRTANRARRILEQLEAAELAGELRNIKLAMVAYNRFRLPGSTGEFVTKTGKVKPEFRAKYCMAFVRGDKGTATYQYSPSTGRAGLHDVGVCGSVWACPVCGERITARRRNDLKHLLAVNDRYFIVMVTYTISHHEGENLVPMVDALNSAITKTKTVRPWVRFVEKWCIVGSVAALEVTYGQNGWHPHKHEMFVIDREKLGLTGPEAKVKFESEMQAELFQMYHHKLNTVGRDCDQDHGLVVTANRKAYGEYIAKWGVTEELTRSVHKAASNGGRSVWELLRDSVRGDVKAWSLWLEYLRAFKGKKQLHWSKGLRELLELGAELSDQEAAELVDIPADQRVVVAVSQMGLTYIHSKDLDGPIRSYIERTGGNTSLVLDYMARMGLNRFLVTGPVGAPT